MRLKPWQRILVTCGRCAALAEYQVTHDHYDSPPSLATMLAVMAGTGELPPADRAVLRFACGQHYNAVMAMVSDCCGSCSGESVRDTWWYWARWRVVYRGRRRIGQWLRGRRAQVPA